MLTIGQTYILEVVKIARQGAYVDAENLGEVLLPNQYCSDDLEAGDHLPVFIYHDSESLPIATTQTPRAVVGQFAYLPVISNSSFGSFLDWGLDKDLLVPFGEQHRPMEPGQSYLVYVHLNHADGRVIGSSKVDKFLDDDAPHEFKAGQSVDLIIANSTDLGFKAIVNHSHWGLLYKNEVHERLSFGQSKSAFIKFVRPDGRVDLALAQQQETRDQYATTVLNYLEANDGFAAAHDKSDPAIILKLFGMSKKVFKKTIGGLYAKRIIKIETDGIRLNRQP
ncbi:MAG: putative RNA-binding protein (virulence factor B family) [Planctomycetaceae bacterium]|jgi:predicted RNA-binding protein (virulence factor B family)